MVAYNSLLLERRSHNITVPANLTDGNLNDRITNFSKPTQK